MYLLSLRLVSLSSYYYDVLFKPENMFKKGYIEMRNFIFIVTVKSVLGESVIHYYLRISPVYR